MFLSLTGSGLALGAIYALQAVSVILLLRAVGVLNFAQGDMLAAGAYAAWLLTNQLHLEGPLFLLALLLFFVVFGAIFMAVTYWPLRHAKWGQPLMICTIGAATVIRELCVLICGAQSKTMEPIIPGSLSIGSFTLPYQYFFVFGICIAALVLVFVLFDKLYAGRAMAAASQNKYAAQLIGIPTALTTLITYALVAIVAGLGGYLVAPLFLVRTSLNGFQNKALCGIVIGGFGSLKGAIVGSLLIGLIESYSTYFTTLYKDLFVFGTLLLFLMIRPQGLFKGEAYQEKA